MKLVDCVIQVVRTELPVTPLREQIVKATQFGTELSVMRDGCEVANASTDGLGEVSEGHGLESRLRVIDDYIKPAEPDSAAKVLHTASTSEADFGGHRKVEVNST